LRSKSRHLHSLNTWRFQNPWEFGREDKPIFLFAEPKGCQRGLPKRNADSKYCNLDNKGLYASALPGG
jgi:hypothetical protein